MKNFYFYLLVFIAGAAVLAIEILGTRILGPFYGVSLFLWSALITVTLIALSVGYTIGGRWADKGAKFSRLCYLMICAGTWLLFIPWIKGPVLTITEPMGLRFAVLIAAFILFTPPLTLLGMVSPYAIRVRAQHLTEVGRTAGDIYAISTVGSIFAALLTGFFLIPNMGVNRLILLIGLVLITSAGITLFALHKKTIILLAMLITLTGSLLTILNLTFEGSNPDKGLLAVEHSAYGEIRVVDTNDGRHMLIDGSIHTHIDPESYASYSPYVYVLDLTRNFFNKPGKMLLIGIGGGAVVKNFVKSGWQVDAVEIDPIVTRMAYQYFGLDSAMARVYHMDGRQYFINNNTTFEMIIMDAFGGSAIPFHLVTKESFGLIKKHLQPDGVFAVNVEAIGWHDMIIRSLTATLRQHFTEVYALPMAEPPNILGNVILLASNTRLEMIQELPPTEDRFSQNYHRNHAWDNRFTADIQNVAVLTDDRNPVDIWSERINFAARKELHNYFRGKGLDW